MNDVIKFLRITVIGHSIRNSNLIIKTKNQYSVQFTILTFE